MLVKKIKNKGTITTYFTNTMNTSNKNIGIRESSDNRNYNYNYKLDSSSNSNYNNNPIPIEDLSAIGIENSYFNIDIK